MTDIAYIYGLIDPRSGEIRYIGQSYRPFVRLQQHIRQTLQTSRKAKWVTSVLKAGARPELKILSCLPKCLVDIEESIWIANLPNLTNGTAGGRGFKNKHSGLTKEKIRLKKTGTRHDRGISKVTLEASIVFRSRPVVDLNTGTVYKSSADAARALGFHRCGVHKAASGARHQIKGKVFRFVEGGVS